MIVTFTGVKVSSIFCIVRINGGTAMPLPVRTTAEDVSGWVVFSRTVEINDIANCVKTLATLTNDTMEEERKQKKQNYRRHF